ncbi:MAG: DUF4012 domain-containing protein [Candidatus Ancillula sp.]|jgi:hypothetical protein|nr:DUF4012 domain-containing protein [Candidatus Ancillula sp.]
MHNIIFKIKDNLNIAGFAWLSKKILQILLAWLVLSLLVIILNGIFAGINAKSAMSALKSGDTATFEKKLSSTADYATAITGELKSPIWAGLNAVAFHAFEDEGDLVEVTDTALRTIEKNPNFATKMLGYDGDFRYLVMFQNNSQIKTLGGSPAQESSILMSKGNFDIDQKMTRGATAFQDNMNWRSLKMNDSTKADGDAGSWFYKIYPDHTFRSYLSQTQHPNFYVDAAGARSLWETAYPKKKLNAVAAFDPVALGYLLDGTDPVCGIKDLDKIDPDSKGCLTRDNAAAVLMNKVYIYYEKTLGMSSTTANTYEDAFFGVAQDAILDAIKSKLTHPAKLARAVADIISERRLLIWFVDDKMVGNNTEKGATQSSPTGGIQNFNNPDQPYNFTDYSGNEMNSMFAGNKAQTNVSGLVPRDTDKTNIGIYFNDVEPSKIDYYIKFGATVKREVCIPQGATYYDIHITQNSLLSPTLGAKLPSYVHNGQTIRSDFYALAPEGASFVGWQAINKGAQSDLFKVNTDQYINNRVLARSRAYMNFASNDHRFLFKKSGFDLKELNVMTTPDINGVKVKTSTVLGCGGDQSGLSSTPTSNGTTSNTTSTDSQSTSANGK